MDRCTDAVRDDTGPLRRPFLAPMRAERLPRAVQGLAHEGRSATAVIGVRDPDVPGAPALCRAGNAGRTVVRSRSRKGHSGALASLAALLTRRSWRDAPTSGDTHYESMMVLSDAEGGSKACGSSDGAVRRLRARPHALARPAGTRGQPPPPGGEKDEACEEENDGNDGPPHHDRPEQPDRCGGGSDLHWSVTGSAPWQVAIVNRAGFGGGSVSWVRARRGARVGRR